jgi:hypothetical protein
MIRRRPFVRFLAVLWATLQLASPGAMAIADGVASGKGTTGAIAHIESGTTSTCPQIHGVDCAICRYLSNVAAVVPGTPDSFEFSVDLPCPALTRLGTAAPWRVLPRSRAPPAV